MTTHHATPEAPEFEIGVIAIENRKLAIFGSRMGFLGPVIQNYEPFLNEAEAISAAREKLQQMGVPIADEISRPRITSMRVSYCKAKKKLTRPAAH